MHVNQVISKLRCPEDTEAFREDASEEFKLDERALQRDITPDALHAARVAGRSQNFFLDTELGLRPEPPAHAPPPDLLEGHKRSRAPSPASTGVSRYRASGTHKPSRVYMVRTRAKFGRD